METSLNVKGTLESDIYWVSAPISKVQKNEHRNHVKYLSVRPDRVCAMDSKRLHVLFMDLGLKPGMYEIIKRTRSQFSVVYVTDNEMYPNIDELLEKSSGIDHHPGSFNTQGGGFLHTAIHDVCTHTQDIFNIYYIMDVLAGDDLVYRTCQTEKEYPLFFKAANRLAAVMPMRR